MQIFPRKGKVVDCMKFGKNVNYNSLESNDSRAAGCTLLCSILCERGSIKLCSCANNKADRKGGTYYTNRNWLIAITREPVTA